MIASFGASQFVQSALPAQAVQVTLLLPMPGTSAPLVCRLLARRLCIVVACVLLAGALSACESLAYLGQSVSGHYALMDQRQSIEGMLQDANLSPDLRAKLTMAAQMRRFATEALALPDNGSYRTYVELKRPYVTWIVIATPALSMRPYPSCFPVIGCVSYRGYFSKQAAQDYAAGFQAAEVDVYVSGAGAYSTLGWFADPILSTMTRRGEAALAAVLFHELAHQKLYVPSDTTFNESYATAIERIGVAAWFTSRDYPHAGALAAYHERAQRRQTFLGIVAEGKSRLDAVYAGSGNIEQKLKAKEAVFTQMRRAYADTVERWGGRSPYAAWFAAPLNNAKLALISTYSEHVHALMQLYQDVGFDVEAFQRAAVALGELSTQARRERLSRLANGS